MRVAATLILLAATHTFAMHVPAHALDITRACYAGFCVESREAFTTIARDPARRAYRVLISRTQSVVYLQVDGNPPSLPCGAVCTIEMAKGEKRTIHATTGLLLARIVGPLEPCTSGGAAFFVHVFVYNPEVNPDWLEIVRECG